MGQLADAKARLAQGAAEEEQSKVKLSMSEKELVNLEARMKAFAKETGDNLKKLENLKAAVQACQTKAKNSGWSAEKDKQLDMQLREAREAVKTLYDVRTTKTTYSTSKKLMLMGMVYSNGNVSNIELVD